MKHDIKKLNELKIAESFMQADIRRGYKYIDKAGEIVNEYYKGDKEPAFAMTQGELVIRQPTELIASLKVSPSVVWAHFLLPNSLDQIATAFEKEMEKICEILEVTEIHRLGWRNYFIYEFQVGQDTERDALLKKMIPSDKLSFTSAAFSSEVGHTKLKINIQKAAKTSDSSAVLLFDIDSYREYASQIEPKGARKELKELREDMQSDEFLSVINTFMTA